MSNSSSSSPRYEYATNQDLVNFQLEILEIMSKIKEFRNSAAAIVSNGPIRIPTQFESPLDESGGSQDAYTSEEPLRNSVEPYSDIDYLPNGVEPDSDIDDLPTISEEAIIGGDYSDDAASEVTEEAISRGADEYEDGEVEEVSESGTEEAVAQREAGENINAFRLDLKVLHSSLRVTSVMIESIRRRKTLDKLYETGFYGQA